MAKMRITKKRSGSKFVVKQVIPKSVLDKMAGKGKQYSRNQKQKIGKKIIEGIKERTAEHNDIDGDTFAPYSKVSKYKKRKEKILGKKIGSSEVDIKLFKKLLNSMKSEVKDNGDLEIFHKGELNNTKAFAHNASSGRPKGLAQRKYFGMNEEDVEEVASKFRGRNNGDND